MINNAVNDPKGLNKLWTPPQRDLSQVTGMLKPTKKKRDGTA